MVGGFEEVEEVWSRLWLYVYGSPLDYSSLLREPIPSNCSAFANP